MVYSWITSVLYLLDILATWGFFGLKLYRLPLGSIVHEYLHVSYGVLQSYTTWPLDCPIMNFTHSPVVRQLDHFNFFAVINDSVMNGLPYKTFIPVGDLSPSSGTLGHKVRTFSSLLTHIANCPSGKMCMLPSHTWRFTFHLSLTETEH